MFRCLLLCLVAGGVVFGDTDLVLGPAPMADQDNFLESMAKDMDGATLPADSGPMGSNMDAKQARQTSDASCGRCSQRQNSCKKEPSCGCKPEPCKCCEFKPCNPCPPCPTCPPCPRCQECKPCKPQCNCQGPCSQCSVDEEPQQHEQNVAIEPQIS